MTLTKHGHRILGTTIEDQKTKIPVTNCGGPGKCLDCTNDELRAFNHYPLNKGTTS